MVRFLQGILPPFERAEVRLALAKNQKSGTKIVYKAAKPKVLSTTFNI